MVRCQLFSLEISMHQTRFVYLILSLIFFAQPSIAADAVAVDVYLPKAQLYHQEINLTGTIEAKQNADLAPLQSGVIEQLFVDDGNNVVKGEKLLQLDATLAKFQLNEIAAGLSAAAVKLAEAERLYQEVMQLSKQQFVAKTLMGERRSNLASAQAEQNEKKASLALQQEVVQRHTLFAPFNGVIASRNADVGEWVNPQSQVFNLVANHALRLKIAIPQEYFYQLKSQPLLVNVIPDHQANLAFKADLSRLVTVSDARTRTVIGLVDIPADIDLIAGMSAQATIRILSKDNTLVWLPKSALKTHPDGGNSIFAVLNNKAKRFIVQVKNKTSKQVAVSGAPSDLAVIVKGVELLKEGTEVTTNMLEKNDL